MTRSAFRSRKPLVGCLAVAAAIVAAPASAEVYELQFRTSSQTGTIFFQAPAPGPGNLPGPISKVWGFETTTGLNGTLFIDSGVQQAVQAIVAAGNFANDLGGTNDNTLESFVPNVSLHPPTSNLSTTWFDNGGLAFTVADGTTLNLFVQPATTGKHAHPARFWIESEDANVNDIIANGEGNVLIDLGAPAPTPGAGYLGLFALALGATALRLRERFTR